MRAFFLLASLLILLSAAYVLEVTYLTYMSISIPEIQNILQGLYSPSEWEIKLAGVHLLLFLLAILPMFKKGTKEHGNAQWATQKEIANPKGINLFSGDKGLIFGKVGSTPLFGRHWGGKYLRMAAPLSCVLFAPPGSGKTASIVIPSILASENSILAFDPKGEICQHTSAHRAKFSRVIRFAPTVQGSYRWNPLSKEELPEKWEEQCTYVEKLATSLFPDPVSGEAHFMSMARTMFAVWTLYFIKIQGETSLPEIAQKANVGGKEGLEEMKDMGDELPDYLQAIATPLIATGEKEFGSISSTFLTQMKIFLLPTISENLSIRNQEDENSAQKYFSFKEMRKERISLYVIVSNDEQEALKDFLGMFFDFAGTTFISKTPSKEDLGITFFLDEFVRLGKMDQLKTLPAISRSYRCNLLFVVQAPSQLKRIYGEKAVDEFIGSCGYVLTFTVNEEGGQQLFSKLIGSKTIKTRSKSSNSKDLLHSSTSEADQGVPLIRPEDLGSMKFGEIIILCQNYFNRPVKAQATFWFREPQLKKIVSQCLG